MLLQLRPLTDSPLLDIVNKHWLVDRPTNPHFTGRQDIIGEIVKTITPEEVATEQRRFVLTGMGGQGKSEICLHVANKIRDRFWGIFWVDVGKIRRRLDGTEKHDADQEDADNNMSEVAEALGCAKTADAVKKTLSSAEPTKPWLLILDNADDPKMDYQIYIPSGNRGSIIITSRNPVCGRRLAATGNQKDLENLEEAECIQLLSKTAELGEVAFDTTDDASAVNLVRDLGYHTLAILHAGSYIATARCSIAEYVELFRTSRQQLLEKSGGQGLSRYDTVYATFGASIEFLEQPETGPSKEARKDSLKLLEVLSTFHHVSVPLDVLADAWEGVRRVLKTPREIETYSSKLTAWHVAQVPDLVKPEVGDVKFRINEAVGRLESLALVRPDVSARAWKSVSMHPLVHGWVSDRQSQQEKKEALRITECIVALSQFGFRSWRLYYPQLAPHLRRLVGSDADLVDEAAECRCVLQVCVQIAWMFHFMGLHGDIYEFTGRIMQRLGLGNQEPTEQLRELYRVFAAAVDYEGSRPAQAVQAFAAIERLDEKTRSGNDQWRLSNQLDLGNAHRKNSQIKEAVALLEKVIKAYEDKGEEDRNLLRAHHTLGLALSNDGRFKDAIAVLENVVRTRQRLFPEDNLDRLRSQNVLAVAYLKNGQIAEATPRLEEVARLSAQTFGEQHLETATTHGWLAGAYQRAGRFTEAIALRERVVGTRRLFLGEKHPNLLTAQHNLATTYLKAGRTQDAIDILERVVGIQNSILAETDQQRLTSQHQLAQALLQAGRVSVAIDLLERVVDIENSTLAETDREKLISQNVLARAYLKDERVADAINLPEKVVAIKMLILAEKDSEMLALQHELGRAYLEDERVTDAIQLLERVVGLKISIMEEKDPSLLASQHVLSRAYLEDERVADAIQLLEKVVGLKISTMEEKDPSLLASQHMLDNAYLKAEKFTEAISTLDHVVQVDSLLYEQGHPERVIPQDLLHHAYATRDRTLSGSSPPPASGNAQAASAPQPVGATTEARANDGPEAEADAEEHTAESQMDSFEGTLSNGLVPSEKDEHPGNLSSRSSSASSESYLPAPKRRRCDLAKDHI